MNWILENLTAVLGSIGGILALLAVVSKNFRELVRAPFKAKHEDFMLTKEKLEAIQSEQESQRNTIKRLNEENEEAIQNAIAKRKEMYAELEQMDLALKDGKSKLNEYKDLLAFHKRYLSYLIGLLKADKIPFKTLEEWK